MKKVDNANKRLNKISFHMIDVNPYVIHRLESDLDVNHVVVKDFKRLLLLPF